MKYTNNVQVRLTDEQTQKIKKSAQELGLPMTSYIRFEILKKIKEGQNSQ